ncbi:MAG: hypothetical protein KF893_17585 [Caldilineaceae bacterium]|nr:hypothetical protein [Caldilineaceae bacterium]
MHMLSRKSARRVLLPFAFALLLVTLLLLFAHAGTSSFTGIASAAPAAGIESPLAMTTVVTVADGDVAGLIAAIHSANEFGTPETPAVVNLASGGNYTLGIADNTDGGANGLPIITGTMTINGNGATIARSSADGTAAFRILQISGTLQLDSVTLRNGSSTGKGFRSGSGGAILNLGVLTLTNSTITGNRADRDGGGIANVAFDQNAYLEIHSSRVLSNTADGNGGGISSHANDQQTAILLVRHSEIAGNQVPDKGIFLFGGFGGGIYSGDSNVEDEFGSGAVGATGFVTITHSSVHHNRAMEAGGGIANKMDGTSRIEMAVMSSAIYSNIVRADGNQVGNGGGLANIDAVLMLQNSTVSGNDAMGFGIIGSGYGGGVYNASRFRDATITSLNSTIAYNQAINGGGGMAYADSDEPATATISLQNSIVSSHIESPSSVGNCASADFVPGENRVFSQGNNLEDKDSCGFNQAGDLSNTDPMLGPLALNPAPGENAAVNDWTHALQADSPAIDAGNNANCPATDQRGVTRPQGLACDIGAYEATDVLFRLYLPTTQK